MITRYTSGLVVSILISGMLGLPAMAQISTKPPVRKVTSEDVQRWIRQASLEYYKALPMSVRRAGEDEEFLFLTNVTLPPTEDQEWGIQVSYLCLGRRDSKGQISLGWYKELAYSAHDPIWLPSSNKDAKTILLLNNGAHIYSIDQNNVWRLVSKYDCEDSPYLNTRDSFVVMAGSPPALHVFYEFYLLRVMNLWTGKSTVLLPQKNKLDAISQFLGVADFDKDGKLDIVGESRHIKPYDPNREPNMTTIHVWNYSGSELKELYAGNSKQSYAVESLLLRTGAKTPPIMAALESHNLPNDVVEWYLHLYSWDGKEIRELGNSKDTVPDLAEYQVADLDGDGVDEIVGLSQCKGRRVIVAKWDGKKLVKQWQSPDLVQGVSLGRVADYDGDGNDEVAAIYQPPSAAAAEIGLLDLRDGKYVGLEKLVYVPPVPVAVEKRTTPLEERLHFQQTMPDRVEDRQTFLVLDGERICELKPTKAEMNPVYTAVHIIKQVGEILKRKLPARSIAAVRKTGKENGKVAEYYEIRVGGMVITKLTTDDATAHNMTLKELAEHMKTVIQRAVTTLQTERENVEK